MALSIGKLVRYKNIEACLGVVLELRGHMAKIRWCDEEIVEWMPLYSLEPLNKNIKLKK